MMMIVEKEAGARSPDLIKTRCAIEKGSLIDGDIAVGGIEQSRADVYGGGVFQNEDKEQLGNER